MILPANGTYERALLIEPPFAVSLGCERDDQVVRYGLPHGVGSEQMLNEVLSELGSYDDEVRF